MKHLLFVLALLISAAAIRADDSIKIPAGIRYKQASAKINEDAKELLRNKFSAEVEDKEVLSLFEEMVICGPGLWRDVKQDESLAKLDKGKIHFQVPVRGADGKVVRVDKLEGKLFQSADEVLAFWKVFVKHTDLSNLKIRKLNVEELRLFWAMIPFDITEPLFILESEKHKLLVVFKSPGADKASEKLKIMWIDD